MTSKRSTTNGHRIRSADARRRQIRLMEVMFAGAAIVATLALCSGARLADADNVGASGTAPTSAHFGPQFAHAASNGSGAGVIAVDDTNPSSGDIFTQNAQGQSTA